MQKPESRNSVPKQTASADNFLDPASRPLSTKMMKRLNAIFATGCDGNTANWPGDALTESLALPQEGHAYRRRR